MELGPRKRILILNAPGFYPNRLGGMSIRAREVAENLRHMYAVSLLTQSDLTLPDGRIIRFLVPGGSPARARRDLGWAWDRARWLARNAIRVRAERMRLRQILSQLRPDVSYLHVFSATPWIMLYELLALGVPVVAWFGDPHGGQLRYCGEAGVLRRLLFGTRALRRETRERITLVFNCAFLQQHYAGLFHGYANQCVIYDGVDVRRFRPLAAPLNEARFVFLGRATEAKGFLDFCRAMVRLPRELIDGIDIIGEGAALLPGIQLLRASGRSDLVRGTGPIAREEVPSRLRRSSVLVLPSQDEGMPACVLEAMACGLAVVATPVGGIPEVLRHGQTGLLVAPGDPEGLVRACRRLAEHRDLRERVGRNGRALVCSRFDASACFAATRRLIAAVIDRAAPFRESPCGVETGQPSRNAISP